MNSASLRYSVILALLFFGVQARALLHEFELKDGRTIKAEITKFNRARGQVDLKREDGKVIRIKADIFIPSDQKYIAQWKESPEEVVLIPAGTNSGIDPEFGDYSLTVGSFYMDQYEVTRELWKKVYKWAIAHGYDFDNSGDGKGGKHPIHTISWYDCVKWCNARSEMDKRTPCYTAQGALYKSGQLIPDCDFESNGFRLPTWEERSYAARGGLSGKRFPWGDTISHKLANYNAKSSLDYDESKGGHPDYDTGRDHMPYTSPVGSFPPNGYGLFDMVGNVNELCWDSDGDSRITHGCSWGSRSEYGLCGYMKDSVQPDFTYRGLGFRTVCK